MSLPGFVGITKIDQRKSEKNVNSGPKNGPYFPRSRSFEVKFTDKVLLNPSNVSTKLRWNNQKRVEEKCKNAI